MFETRGDHSVVAFEKGTAVDPYITHYIWVPEHTDLAALQKEYEEWRGVLSPWAPYPEHVMIPKAFDWQEDDDRLIRFPDWLVLKRGYAPAAGPFVYTY